ncbi:MAG: hypothetical protein R3F60_30445 [bacterium]
MDAHALGHAGLELGDPAGERARAWRAEVQANRRFKASLVARFLDQLAPAEDAAGPLLDRTLVLHIAEFSNAALHIARDLPVMLAGNVGACARVGTSRSAKGARRHPGDPRRLSDAVVAAQPAHQHPPAFGFEDEHFGDDRAAVQARFPGVRPGAGGARGATAGRVARNARSPTLRPDLASRRGHTWDE